MCSRFELKATPDEAARRFGLETPPPLPNPLEFRPTDLALVITAEGPRLLTWGLSVDWDTKPLINARAETLSRKKTFRPFLETRCLIPASAYFEWRKDGAARRKNRISLSPARKEVPLFAFAGLSDGARFTIITCAPTPSIAGIHDRMPVILNRRAEARWIDPGIPFEAVSECLVPYTESPIEAEEDAAAPVRQADLFD
jgi:putative SOS response-associated peptidase YedK